MSDYSERMQEVVEAWQPVIDSIDDWQQFVEGTEPVPTGCGPVYELPKPIDRPDESFAIADMRDITFAEPHYHPTDVTEIYMVLQGLGLIVVGGKEQEIKKGSVVITPPNTSHFTIPKGDLVLAVINTPPFRPEDYISLDPNASNAGVSFSTEQFKKLTS